MGNKGLKFLSDTINSKGNLESLSLGSNGIKGKCGGKLIKDILKSNKKLKYLDIHANNFPGKWARELCTEEGKQAIKDFTAELLEVLKNHPSLEKIWVVNTNINKELMKKFVSETGASWGGDHIHLKLDKNNNKNKRRYKF